MRMSSYVCVCVCVGGGGGTSASTTLFIFLFIAQIIHSLVFSAAALEQVHVGSVPRAISGLMNVNDGPWNTGNLRMTRSIRSNETTGHEHF